MSVVDPAQPFQYLNGEAPSTYRCGECGKRGCKLWREYNTFLSHQRLYCYRCALANQGEDPIHLRDGDQIGWLIPAVPTEENDTFWGYSSVPQEGVDWWHSLPGGGVL